jgi:hypothetical protein
MPGQLDGWDTAVAMRAYEAAAAARDESAADSSSSGSDSASDDAAGLSCCSIGSDATDSSGTSARSLVAPARAVARRRRAVIVACTACPLDLPVPGRPTASRGGGASGGCAGEAAASVREFTLSCGADAVVSKPIATHELRRVVEGLLLLRDQEWAAAIEE